MEAVHGVRTGDTEDAALSAPVAAGSSALPALELTGIVKSWNPDAPPVLPGVDLAVEAGTAVSISGPNGAGKTTLLRVAAGLIAPDGGAVRLAGLDPERQRTDFQRRIGFLAAGNTGLYARLKAEHHLDLWARLALLPNRERRAAIDRALAQFELQPLCGRRVDRLSMGQRQRLRLALAFLHDPSVVLLDEPATSLDEGGIGLLQAALDEVRARGGGAVVCLPSGWDQVVSLDRALVLDGGRLEDR
jgi:ABC-2 type transport system ATP-binding protein